jgi:hypothetical protein
MSVDDSHDANLLWIDAIDPPLRSAFQALASVVAFVGRPKPGKLLSPYEYFPNFIEELLSQTSLFGL